MLWGDYSCVVVRLFVWPTFYCRCCSLKFGNTPPFQLQLCNTPPWVWLSLLFMLCPLLELTAVRGCHVKLTMSLVYPSLGVIVNIVHAFCFTSPPGTYCCSWLSKSGQLVDRCRPPCTLPSWIATMSDFGVCRVHLAWQLRQLTIGPLN